MVRNTTVDSVMPMSLVSWSAVMRPGTFFAGSASVGSANRPHLVSALTRRECGGASLNSLSSRSVSGASHRAVALAGLDWGGIRPFAAEIVEQPFGGMRAEMALHADGDRNPESAFVSKVTYGRSHVPAVRRRRGEG